MLGAVTGDIVGSVYEFDSKKPPYNFNFFHPNAFFTDDSVLTIALADSILSGTSYRKKMIEYYNKYPDRGYGGMFHQWAMSSSPEPYNSWGNGSAMRVSPVGWLYNDLDKVLKKSEESAAVTHNHPEGIKGAQATAAAIYLARTGNSKQQIKEFVESTFNYALGFNIEELRENYQFNESCRDTVPQAIFTFLEADSFEDSIRKAIYIGGDSDTVACINGSIAEAFYGIPDDIKKESYERLTAHLKKIVDYFYKTIVK